MIPLYNITYIYIYTFNTYFIGCMYIYVLYIRIYMMYNKTIAENAGLAAAQSPFVRAP